MPGATATSVLRLEDARPTPGIMHPGSYSSTPVVSMSLENTGSACRHAPAEPSNATKRHRSSKHVLLDAQVRHDLAADLLDRGVGGIERGDVLVAENTVRDGEFALAAIELRV